MGTKLPPRHLELYRTIGEILWRDWDPIGICGTAQARNEYEGYLPQVFRLALAGDRARIAEYLFSVATDQMGLATQLNQHLSVADKILVAKDR